MKEYVSPHDFQSREDICHVQGLMHIPDFQKNIVSIHHGISIC